MVYSSSSSAARSFSVESRPSAKWAAKSWTEPNQPGFWGDEKRHGREFSLYSAFRALKPAVLRVAISVPTTCWGEGKNASTDFISAILYIVRPGVYVKNRKGFVRVFGWFLWHRGVI